MEMRQVLLICFQPLLSEGLQRIFQTLEDVDLVPLPGSHISTVEAMLERGQPDVIVVAGEEEDEQVEHLITVLLGRCNEVPIVLVGLEDSQLHIISSRILPASTAGLVDAIRQVAAGNPRRKKLPPNLNGGDNYAI